MNRNKDQKTVSNNHVCPPPTISNIRLINVSEPSENLHLGTVVTLNGPVNLIGLTMQDILSINGSLNGRCTQLKQNKYVQGKKNKSDIRKAKKELSKICTVKNCLFFVLYFFSVQGVFLFFLNKDKALHQKEYRTGICVQKLNEINSMLPNFYPRKSWGIDNNCTYRVFLKNVKTKIKLSIVDPILWSCLHDASSLLDIRGESCDTLLGLMYARHRDKLGLNDVYYNYMLSYYGDIFEGRPLNCEFEKEEEVLLSEDHSEVITVGIPYCFQDSNIKNKFNQSIPNLAISGLTRELLNSSILSKNYSIEIPDVCKQTFLMVMTKQNHVIPYVYDKKDIFSNIKKSKDFMKTFLFKPINDSELLDFHNVRYKWLPLRYNNLSRIESDYLNNNNSRENLELVDQYNSLLANRHPYLQVTFSQTSLPFENSYYETSEELIGYLINSEDKKEKLINYYIHPRFDNNSNILIIEHFSIECALILEEKYYVIDITIDIKSVRYFLNLLKIEIIIMFQVLQSIVENLENRIPLSLKHFDVEIFYEEPLDGSLLLQLYELMGKPIKPITSKTRFISTPLPEYCYCKRN